MDTFSKNLEVINQAVENVYRQSAEAENRTGVKPDEIILGGDILRILLENSKSFYGLKLEGWHSTTFLGMKAFIDFENKDRIYVIPKMNY